MTSSWLNFLCKDSLSSNKVTLQVGLPKWLSGWRICQQCRRPGCEPWAGKIPWRRKWQLTRISCLENSIDRGAGQAAVCGMAKSRTQLSDSRYKYWALRIQYIFLGDTVQFITLTNLCLVSFIILVYRLVNWDSERSNNSLWVTQQARDGKEDLNLISQAPRGVPFPLKCCCLQIMKLLSELGEVWSLKGELGSQVAAIKLVVTGQK